MRKMLRTVALGVAVGLSLTACAATGESEVVEGLPQQLVWSTYGLGTSTYADVAAVTGAITSGTDHTARIITADTAIGRLGPLKQGKSDMARTGNEYIYAFEADFEFASEDWGPQDLQLVWAPVAPHGLMVRDSSEIKSYDDLRGVSFPHITANPSVNNSLTAMLAYGGLTWDDVEPVEISYSEQADAVKSGQLDVLFQQVYGASLYELESAFPVRWLSMDDDSPKRVAAVAESAPYAAIGDFTGAAGQEDGESARGLIYTLPLVTYAGASESSVYETAKAIQDNYDEFKDSTATTQNWSLELANTVPTKVPFHAGTVKFLKENNAWSDEADKKNKELIERGEKLRAGWEDFIGSADKTNLAEEWATWKETNLSTL
ncbi:TAXI family TRAP transporter solute-binding subunit [Cryobacterium sp. PH29-G1]|uniref:TAXI family TRAP transporter solute-binding subunit n=1 Tax=Cryobacterium sp. PH29-G1 TaxID=3046211 RepID=UPI0024B98AB6|nr:TAXI family TRAP transporter solute-binding subunit [Cryobacterium sp. PH29-G1]MDJ0350751.1 TAXI family TRAP transporter solute-binding subunit [Cryobacterium sp. PH29-G1]